MLKTAFLGMAALAALAVGAPAEAQWVKLSDVHIDHRRDRETTWSQFAGPVERLSFTARGSDMWCRSIGVEYSGGGREQVYSGKLVRDRPANVDVTGGQRRIARLNMNCAASEPRGGILVVAADVGRFHQAWEKSKMWASRMARKFEQNIGMNDRGGHNGWVTIGRENFEGRRDSEQSVAGWRGRNVDRIALRPVDNDARCMRVSATSENGRTRDLDINRRDVLERGRMTEIDLPGGERNLRSVDLSCRAVGDRTVTIEILAKN
jgi:hypothetical protein